MTTQSWYADSPRNAVGDGQASLRFAVLRWSGAKDQNDQIQRLESSGALTPIHRVICNKPRAKPQKTTPPHLKAACSSCFASIDITRETVSFQARQELAVWARGLGCQ
eukprot:2111005-Amphidinium_carterae.2